MKIAIVSTPFVSVPPKGYGGTELVVAELVDGLVERGHDVSLFATGDSETSARLYSLYPEAVWPPNPLADSNHVSWAMQRIAHGDFDVIHANSTEALACGRFCKRAPLAYTIHHTHEDTFSGYYAHFQDVQYIAISADQMSREPQLKQVSVIHHGLDPAKYEWRDSRGDYAFFIGRFTPYKGPHTAIDAAERAGLPIRVAGVAHDETREWSDREVLPRLDRPHVTFMGSVGMREKVPLLRDARVLLAPITWDEPFGLVLIEAMLSGCPVVAYPRGSVPELVEPGVTGFIVNDADALTAAIRPGGPVDRLDRARCRERAVERFGRDRMARDHERLYARINEAARRMRRKPSRGRAA